MHGRKWILLGILSLLSGFIPISLGLPLTQTELEDPSGKMEEPGLAQTIILSLIAARGLPSTDLFGGEPDPFIQISYANGSTPEKFEHFARTKTLEDEHEAEWTEMIPFEKYLPRTGQMLQFELRDHDANDFDDRIGYAYINIDACVKDYQAAGTEYAFCHAQISGGNGLLYIHLL